MNITVVEEYIETGNFQDLDLLLSKEPTLVNEKTSHGISPLLLACYYHKHQIIPVILKYISTITIHEACAVGLKDHIAMMLAHQPTVVDELSTQGFTPIGIATHFEKEEIVRLLLAQGADANIPSQNGYSVYPLHTALNANNSAISKMLIEAGAAVDIVQQGGIMPIHLAAQHGNVDIIIQLLELGVDITVRTAAGESAAELAASKGFHELAKILTAT